MEINVRIPDALAAQAKARGLGIEEYIQELLAHLPESTSVDPSLPKTGAEIRAWLASMTQFSDKIPSLPETISRNTARRRLVGLTPAPEGGRYKGERGHLKVAATSGNG